MKRALPLLLVIAALAAAGCDAARSDAPTASSPAPAATGPATAATEPATAATEPATAATEPATAGAGPGDGTAVKSGSTPGVQAAPRFRGQIVAGREAVRSRVRYSWRRGCPVGPVELRLLRVDHWGLDGRVHRGELIVHRDHARRVLAVMGKLFTAGYPIQRLRLVDAYRASDDRSMAANNTSAFNCRRVSGSSRWSEHAFGRAIDVNPLRNPYVTSGGRVSPPAGRPYADRARRAAGMIHGGDTVVRAFAAAGWRWGGYWSGSKDYQHFSSTGR
jgi:poly-gamma-glutamate synthesis protein (capsule biosynthesis protein)